ncbi:hypothetical protein V8E54_005925 [Elaphomyces granulatus]
MSGSPWAKEWKSLASDNSQKAILLPTFYKTFDTWPTDISQEIIKKNSSPVAIRVDDQRSRADCPRPRPASGRCRCWANTIRHGDVIAMVAGCATADNHNNFKRSDFVEDSPPSLQSNGFGPASIELPTERAGANIIVCLYLYLGRGEFRQKQEEWQAERDVRSPPFLNRLARCFYGAVACAPPDRRPIIINCNSKMSSIFRQIPATAESV